MLSDKESIQPFLDEDETIEEYYAEMLKQGTWGG